MPPLIIGRGDYLSTARVRSQPGVFFALLLFFIFLYRFIDSLSRYLRTPLWFRSRAWAYFHRIKSTSRLLTPPPLRRTTGFLQQKRVLPRELRHRFLRPPYHQRQLHISRSRAGPANRIRVLRSLVKNKVEVAAAAAAAVVQRRDERRVAALQVRRRGQPADLLHSVRPVLRQPLEQDFSGFIVLADRGQVSPPAAAPVDEAYLAGFQGRRSVVVARAA